MAALAEGTVVTRLVVVEGPWQHGPAWAPEIPACTLDEFRSLLATQDWQSTDREELWSFLDELTGLGADANGGGWAGMMCWSILDAWQDWQSTGMLCPAWVQPGTLRRIPPRDLDYQWERDAILDPADAILTGLGMAGAREWPHLVATPVPAARPGTDDRSIVVTLALYAPRRITWVAVDMGLVVGVDLEFRAGPPFGRAAMGTLANTIQDTLRELARRNPGAWKLWREAHGEQPVAIQLMTGHLARDTPALRLIGIARTYDLLYADPEKLPGLTADEVHDLIGEALASSMLARLQPLPEHESPSGRPGEEAESVGVQSSPDDAQGQDGEAARAKIVEFTPSEEDLDHAESFIAAWRAIQPRFTQRVQTTPFGPYGLTSAQTLTESGQDRAKRRVARRLRDRLIPGTHPLSAVLSELCPGALDALSDAADSFSPRAALAAACAELERAESDRFASRASLETDLDSIWADEALSELDIDASSDQVQRSRVAGLLTEHLLSKPSGGSLVPDRRDVHQLLDLASAALSASLEAQYAFAALQPAELEVSAFGDIEISRTGAARADIGAWQQARLEDQARAYISDRTGQDSPEDDHVARQLNPEGSGDAGQRGNLRSVLRQTALSGQGFESANAKGLLAVDDQLTEHRGFGLDAIVAVLGTAASWDVPAEPNPPIAQVSRAALVDSVTAFSGLPQEQVEAAACACTLTGEMIRREGLRYWQIKERSARLALRPLIEPPDAGETDELWLLPRCAHLTQRLLLTYLNDQQLPWPDRELPDAVLKAVNVWHRQAEEQLETELATAAASAGLPFRPKLTPSKAARQGLHLPGEIDLIAADALRGRIWVIEAKHLRQIYSPLEIGSRIADFHGAEALALGQDTFAYSQLKSRTFRSVVGKLTAKAQAVRQNKAAAVRLIAEASPKARLTDAVADDWEVIPLVVTTSVEVAAFVPDPAVTFASINHLADCLVAAEQSPSGWWPGWVN